MSSNVTEQLVEQLDGNNFYDKIIADYHSHIASLAPLEKQLIRRKGLGEKETLTLNTASIGRQLQRIKADHFPTLSNQEWQKYLTNNALCGSGDGVKISLIDQLVGTQIADTIVDSNQAIIYAAAKAAGFAPAVMTYSGDEFVHILIPLTLDEDRNAMLLKFQDKANELMTTIYDNPTFQKAKDTLQQYFPDSQLGFTLSPPSNLGDVYYYNPNPELSVMPKRVVGAIIDGEDRPEHPSYSPVADILLQIHEDETISNIYPRELEVSESNESWQRAQTYLAANRDSELYLVKVANVKVKEANKKSHALGDHEIVATVSIIRRLANDLGVTGYLNIEQRFGSFILTLDQNAYTTMQPYLADSAFLNTYYHDQDQQRSRKDRQDPSMRAKPFLIATTKINGQPVTIDGTLDQITYYKLIESFKEPQALKEIASLIVYTGIANYWPHTVINTCKQLIAKIEGVAHIDADIIKHQAKLSWLNQVLYYVLKYRPDVVERLLIPKIPKNYKKAISTVPGRVSRLVLEEN